MQGLCYNEDPAVMNIFSVHWHFVIVGCHCSNHRLESAGLNALEELLFKMLGMGALSAKDI